MDAHRASPRPARQEWSASAGALLDDLVELARLRVPGVRSADLEHRRHHCECPLGVVADLGGFVSRSATSSAPSSADNVP